MKIKIYAVVKVEMRLDASIDLPATSVDAVFGSTAAKTTQELNEAARLYNNSAVGGKSVTFDEVQVTEFAIEKT